MDSPANSQAVGGQPVLALCTPPPTTMPPLSWVPLSPIGVAEQFAITEATLSAWSSLDDEELHPEDIPQDMVQLQGTAWVGAPGRGGWSRAAL